MQKTLAASQATESDPLEDLRSALEDSQRAFEEVEKRISSLLDEIRKLQKTAERLWKGYLYERQQSEDFWSRMIRNMRQKEILYGTFREVRDWFNVHPDSFRTPEEIARLMTETLDRYYAELPKDP